MEYNQKFYFNSEYKKDIYVAFSRKDITTICQANNQKYYLIVMFIRKHTQLFGEVSFTLNKLMEECGYSTKSHNDSIYSDFRRIIKEEIIDKGFAHSDDDIITIKPTNVYTLQLDNHKLFISDDSYVCITIQEFESIVNINNCKINKATLFIVYMYMKQFIFVNSTDKLTAQISYPSKQQIANGLGLSSTSTIEKSLAALEDNKLLFVMKNIFVQDNKNSDKFVSARNVYALKKEHLDRFAVINELEAFYKRKVTIKNDS